jgi:hypothetical protein
MRNLTWKEKSIQWFMMCFYLLKLDMILSHLSLSISWIRFIPIILRDYLCLFYELKLSITSSMDNLVHAMKFPCFSNLSLHSLSKMITKMESSACVTNNISLWAYLWKYTKKKVHEPQGLLFTQRKKGKSKVWELFVPSLVICSKLSYSIHVKNRFFIGLKLTRCAFNLIFKNTLVH